MPGQAVRRRCWLPFRYLLAAAIPEEGEGCHTAPLPLFHVLPCVGKGQRVGAAPEGEEEVDVGTTRWGPRGEVVVKVGGRPQRGRIPGALPWEQQHPCPLPSSQGTVWKRCDGGGMVPIPLPRSSSRDLKVSQHLPCSSTRRCCCPSAYGQE